jgi:hypothetical protein
VQKRSGLAIDIAHTHIVQQQDLPGMRIRVIGIIMQQSRPALPHPDHIKAAIAGILHDRLQAHILPGDIAAPSEHTNDL